MQNRKLAILIILLIVAVFVWIPKGRRAPRGTGTQAPLQKSARPLLKTGDIRKRSGFTDWGRNPFAWPREGASPISGLRLSGIVWDEQVPYAIINGAVLHPGDKINDKTVKHIEQDKVILTDGLSDFTLELE